MVLSKRSGEDIWIAPSLLAADFSRLAEQIELIEAGQEYWQHYALQFGEQEEASL